MPSDHTMQFFTPELYLRFNSARDEEALAADEEWETAIARYHAHLESIGSEIPSQVLELTKTCLHDADILLRQERQEPLALTWANKLPAPWPWVPWMGVFTVYLRLDDQVLDILYFLWDHVAEKPPTPNWPFSSRDEHWLYDEVNYARGPVGHFVHNVLLSSGIVLSIPFSAVLIRRLPAGQSQGTKRPSKSA